MTEDARIEAEKAEMTRQPLLSPDFDFLEKIEAAGPFNAAACFQCRKCTNGCPASFAMDIFPTGSSAWPFSDK